MSVDVLTSRDAFRLTLSSPATVDPLSGEIALTPTNLSPGGGAGSFTTLAASGATTLSGNLTVGASKLTVVAASGNTVIAGTLSVIDQTSVTGFGAGPGNNRLTVDAVTGVISMVLSPYADNAAALLGGLVATNLYYNSTTNAVSVVV